LPTSHALLALLLLMASLPLALAGSPTTLSAIYVGGLTTVLADVPACGEPVGVGAVCFPLDGAARSVDIHLADVSGLPVGAFVEVRNPFDGFGFRFCNDIGFSYPPGMTELKVGPSPYVNGLTQGNLSGLLGCPGQGTVGTVYATFAPNGVP